MAILYITEFDGLAKDDAGNIMPAGKMPARAQQTVTYTTNAQSAAFSPATELIRVVADANAHLQFGSNPTATASDMLLTSGVPEYFGVKPGHLVAAYDGSS